MGRVVVPYADFSGGDWGRTNAWNAPKGSFDAKNMYVTKTGELTVRPGLRLTTPTGVAAGATQLLGGFPDDGSTTALVWYVQGTAPWNWRQFDPANPVAANIAAPGPVTALDTDGVGSLVYGVSTSGVFSLGKGGPATSFTGAPTTGQSVALYLNRLVVSITGTNQLRWSDVDATTGAPNFNSWTATNTANVGDSSPIVAIRAQRTHLVVFKQGGGMYVITGDMAVSTVRQVARTPGPPNGGSVQRSRDEYLWYVGGSRITPWRFDGTRFVEMEKYTVPTDGNLSGLVAVAGLPTEEHGVFILSKPLVSNGQSYGWLYLNGVWTKHTFPFVFLGAVAATSGVALDDPAASSLTEAFYRSYRMASELTFSDLSATPKFYTLSLAERPGSESHPFPTATAPERAGDDSTSQVVGSVTFPEWHSQAGEDAMVKTVIVDFRAYNTGGSLTNHFDLNVTALRLYDTDGPQASATLSYDEAGASAATGGTLERRIFSFGDQGPGNGFQVSLTNVRGIALQRVTVVVDTQTTRGNV